VERRSTAQGDYFSLYDSVFLPSNGPAQPLHFGDVSANSRQARGVILLGATYSTTANFDPLVLEPYNEFMDAPAEGALARDEGWYPPVPVSLQTSAEGKATLTTQVGQYDATTGNLRLYSSLDAEVYYGSSADQSPPQITVVDGLYKQGQVEIKVGAVDPSGIGEVFVSYEDSRQSNAAIQSLKLTYNPTSQKWVGSFPGGEYTRFFVQVVDNAGNVLADVNKGRKYTPAPDTLDIQSTGNCGAVFCAYFPLLGK